MEHTFTMCLNTHSGLHTNLTGYASIYIRFSNNTVGVSWSYTSCLYTYLSSIYSHCTITWFLALWTVIHWPLSVKCMRNWKCTFYRHYCICLKIFWPADFLIKHKLIHIITLHINSFIISLFQKCFLWYELQGCM
jgi:hypothetical protein